MVFPPGTKKSLTAWLRRRGDGFPSRCGDLLASARFCEALTSSIKRSLAFPVSGLMAICKFRGDRKSACSFGYVSR
jgi:hypothetical protein